MMASRNVARRRRLGHSLLVDLSCARLTGAEIDSPHVRTARDPTACSDSPPFHSSHCNSFIDVPGPDEGSHNTGSIINATYIPLCTPCSEPDCTCACSGLPVGSAFRAGSEALCTPTACSEHFYDCGAQGDTATYSAQTSCSPPPPPPPCDEPSTHL